MERIPFGVLALCAVLLVFGGCGSLSRTPVMNPDSKARVRSFAVAPAAPAREVQVFEGDADDRLRARGFQLSVLFGGANRVERENAVIELTRRQEADWARQFAQALVRGLEAGGYKGDILGGGMPADGAIPAADAVLETTVEEIGFVTKGVLDPKVGQFGLPVLAVAPAPRPIRPHLHVVARVTERASGKVLYLNHHYYSPVYVGYADAPRIAPPPGQGFATYDELLADPDGAKAMMGTAFEAVAAQITGKLAR